MVRRGLGVVGRCLRTGRCWGMVRRGRELPGGEGPFSWCSGRVCPSDK